MKVARACFAVIVKLSGLTQRLESVLQNLELQELDFVEAEDPAERLKLMKEAVKEMSKDTPLLFREWCNATKMRKWLKEKVMSLHLDIDKTEDSERLATIVSDVVSKAEFLIKLEKPHYFHTLNPHQELFELSYKVPSYAREEGDKDEEENEPFPEDKK